LSANGTLSGTLTAVGTFTFTAEVDSNITINNVPQPTLTGTQAYTIVIYPALAITTPNASPGTVSVPYSQTFAATGGAGAATYTWSLSTAQPPPGLSLSAAGVLSGIPTTPGTYNFQVQVFSPIPNFGTAEAVQSFTVVIAPIPPLTITGTLAGGTVGGAYSATLGATGGYGAGTYTFAVTSGTPPSGTNLSAGGTLSGTLTAVGTFTFTVQVTSTYPIVGTNFQPLISPQSFTVVVYPVLAITPLTASPGTVGTAYSQTFTATGGAGPSTYTWSLTTSTQPPGLTLSSAGVLSGTPTTAGTFTFSVQVSSLIPAVGTVTASQSFTVVIAAPPALAIAGGLSSGIVGGAYSATLGATGGYGAGTYTFSVTSGAPPSGTTLSAGGTLSGTLTAVGSFTFTVQVASTLTSSFLPITATQPFTVVIYPGLAITTVTASPGIVGTAYSQTFTATGGAGPSTYTWSMAGDTLPPPGLALSAAGVLSGTPTIAGTFPFQVQVSSQVPALGAVAATQGFSVVIASPSITIAGTLNGGMVGAAYSATLGATGGYGPGTYTFSATSGTPPSGTTLSAAGTLSGTLTAAGSFTFTVQATSTLSSSFLSVTGTQSFTVVVYPLPTITTATASPGAVGAAYSQTFTATGGAGPSTYTWSFAGGTPPPGLTLSAAGVLSGTPTAAGSFSIYVQVSSQIPTVGAQTASQWFTVVITATPSLTIAGSLSGGTVGVPYSSTLIGSGGYGTGAYTFSLVSGTPPAGLTLSGGGILSGTPTAAGTSTFIVQVTNTYPSLVANFPPLTGTQSVTVVIYPVLAITTATASPGAVGGAYYQAFAATGGAGVSTYTWSLAGGTLPPGLTLSAAGVLSGTPTAAGSFTFSVQVSSQIPTIGTQTASQGFNVAIATVPSLSIAGILSGGTVGVPYSGTLTGFGGYAAGAYTFSLASGTLPPGLALSASGTLAGTPTAAGTSNFTVQVASASTNPLFVLSPLTATQSYTVVIYPVLAITTAAANSGTVGVAYSQLFAATGGAGTSTYTWSVATGAPPPGLTFSAAGVLSGTPTASGTFNFTVQVSSQVPTIGVQTATQAISIVINAVGSLTITGSLGAATAGVPYSATLGATGGYGTGTYTFSLVSGALPTGLTLSAGGTLSGTPTGAGTFTFMAQVTSTLTSAVANLQPLSATQSFTVTVAAVALTISGTPGSGTVGVPYSATLTGSGGYGTGTYTFSLASGTLPADMTLSAGGILSGTPTAVGTSTFTVEVTSTQTGQPLTATQSFTITVGVAAAPPMTILGLPATPAAATQLGLGVSAGSTYPIAIQGTITLTFAPTSGPDDPNVQFTTGGRTVAFQIPAGSSLAQFPGGTPSVQTGTVAGTITLTLTLTAAGVDITPAPAPTQVLLIAKSAPVITSAIVTPTTGGFNLLVVGYSTTRDMVSAAITFTPAAGVTLASNSTTVSLSQIFTTWYQSSTSAPFGSMFSLEIPFTIQNGTNPLASVSVALTNSQGSSAAATATF
jgi:hypothetical protein